MKAKLYVKALNFLIFLLLSMFTSIGYSSEVSEKTFEKKVSKHHHFSLLFGEHTLSTTSTSVSGIGSLSAVYSYSFLDRVSVLAAYNMIMKTDGGIGSVATGFDIGAQYCLLSCYAEKKNIDDIITVTKHPKFGILLGAGLAQRALQLSSTSLSYSGPFVRTELNYFVSENLKALLSAQYASLSNGKTALIVQTITLGVGFDFGQ